MTARHNHGFTLIETLITTAVLVSGLTAVACLFSYTAGTNARNQLRTAAAVLLSDKMEELKLESLEGKGGPGEYSEYVTIRADGELIVDGDNGNAPYLRRWKISNPPPREAVVIVYGRRADFPDRYRELARGTMMLGRAF